MDGGELRRFEEACEWLARGDNARKHEAEAVLLDFRKRAGAVDGATAIVGSSQHVFVQFQAALVLRHAALDQWSALSPQERVQLRRTVLHMVVERCNDFHRTVRKQLLQALAVMWKRGWLEDQNDPALVQAKNELFEQIRSLLASGGAGGEASSGHPSSPQALSSRHAVALQLLGALVEEFSSSKASELGLSLAFHRECHESFERAGLKEAFMMAAALLRGLAAGINPTTRTMQAGPDTEEVVRSSLSLLESCLAWDFQCGDAGSQANRTFQVESALARGREHVSLRGTASIKPGAGWRDVLLQGGLLETLFRLYAASRGASAGHAGAGEDIAHQIRQLFIMLASVNGAVFADTAQRAKYLDTMLQGSLFGVIADPLVPIEAAAGLSQTFVSTAAGSKEALCAAGGAEFLDMCALFARLMSNFSVNDILSAEMSGVFPRMLGALSQLSKSILEGAARNAAGPAAESGMPSGAGPRTHDEDDDVDNSWLMEAFGSLLEVWGVFTTWAEALGARATSSEDPPSALETEAHRIVCGAAGDLYQFYLEKRLVMARASMEREAFETFEEEFAEDESALDDHLLSISSLGRADVVRSMMANISALQRLSADLMASASQPWSEESSMRCSQVAEQLFWVVLLASGLLADPADGERPMIPACIIASSMQFCAQASGAGPMTRQTASEDPCVKLSQGLLQLLQFEAERVRGSNGEDERISPLLSSKLLAAVTRWSMTYLLPERGLYGKSTRIQDGLPASIDLCFAQPAQAEELISFLVECATHYVSNWGTETSVNPEALNLLRAVVDNSACRRMLQQMSSWGTLCEAHVRSVRDANWKPLDGLTVRGQGTLLQVLLMSLEVGQEAPTARREHLQGLFAQLVEPVQQRLDSLASRLVSDAQRVGKENVGSVLSDPHFLQDLERVMNMYVGAVQAASFGPLAGWCRDFVLGALSSRWAQVGAAALTFIKRDGLGAAVSGSARRVISEVLELIEAYMELQLESTPTTQLAPAFEAADRILQVFAEFQRHLASHPGQFKTGEEDAWCRDVLRLMRLIRHITFRDQLDFSENPVNLAQAQGPQPVQVVIKGVQLVFPLVTDDLLQFPGIAEEFFNVLRNLVDAYPSEFATLSREMFNPILKALEFGMSDHRVSVSRNSFEALTCLAEFHVEQAAQGGPGLGANLRPNGPGTPSVLLQLLQKVFNFIVFQTFDSSLLNPAANAMFALIASEQESFGPMVEGIIASQEDPAMRERLSRAFTGLVQNNDVQLRFDRINRRRFQKNVVDFVNQVRGFMRKK
ncbi:Exportin-4 [Hondaea fermentalgiana]|uniref:Exportin-4 n=1 Tax=Hondaea fermentalgiana TaxID=2315210 RepID=A0A2R5GCM3_9STRA|nr:Exportin-4 [Hondaea fermentalgiana]|eukprot:GBG28089.1 Exportin-4 [Hondaea fermentalgiana]